jgi:hypothetical protein
MTPAELAIRNAMLAVEEAGCDVQLTDAVTLLAQARDKVADFVDKKPAKVTCPLCSALIDASAPPPCPACHGKLRVMDVPTMIRGLVRAAESRERDEPSGKVWDDEVRLALEAARARGWGKNATGTLEEKLPTTLDEVEEWLRSRFARRGPLKLLIDRKKYRDDETTVRLRLWTTMNVYSIVAKPGDFSAYVHFNEEGMRDADAGRGPRRKGYLGCVASRRASRPGEEHTRGNDLADGPLNEETWLAILSDIVHYEALEVSKRAEIANDIMTVQPMSSPRTDHVALVREPKLNDDR